MRVAGAGRDRRYELGLIVLLIAVGVVAPGFSLSATLYSCIGCALAAGLVCLRLEETMPARETH